MTSNGWKLYDEGDSFFSWHETLADAEFRQRFERDVYGRNFRIATLTDAEVIEYSRHNHFCH